MPEPPVETMILRFRDLVTRTGETVQFHKQIISEKDHVWWGWWHKSGETIPEVFRPLLEKAKREGLCVLLLDTGSSKVYKAKCNDIEWDGKRLREIETPEPDCTPEYYRNRENLAWFRFVEITDPIDEKTLRGYTYCRVDDFFIERSSRYGPFYGKIVYSIQELRQQERSIWFVRRQQKGDRINEITLFDAHEITPDHFLAEPPLYSRLNTLVWVSDLHYGPSHSFPSVSTVADKALGLSLEDTLKGEEITPAALLVTGDISDKAQPDEFHRATTDIFEWAKRWGIDRYYIAICPGNHDLAWSEDSSDATKPITVTSDESRKAFGAFYQGLFYVEPNEFLSSGRSLLLGGMLPVDIVSLNSSYLQQLKGAFQGHGFVGDAQLNHAAEKMGWSKQPDSGGKAFRVVMLHHHVFPVTNRESPEANKPYSVVLDAGAFQKWIIKYRVDLVLHGHMHEPCHYIVERSASLTDSVMHKFHVVGMGSTGAVNTRNTFAILEFGPSKLTIVFRSLHQKDPSELIAKIQIPYERSST